MENEDPNKGFLKVKIHWQCNENSFSSQISYETENKILMIVEKS